MWIFIQRLAEWVEVQSVSAWPEKRGEIKKMMEMAAKDIEKLGGTTEMVDIGTQKVKTPDVDMREVKEVILTLCRKVCTVIFCSWLQLPSGEEIALPPIVLGQLGSDPRKKTVCIYGHLDVQPASIDDGWDTEPFKLVEKDGETKSLWFLPGLKLHRRYYGLGIKTKVVACMMSRNRGMLFHFVRRAMYLKTGLTLGFLLQSCVIYLENTLIFI